MPSGVTLMSRSAVPAAGLGLPAEAVEASQRPSGLLVAGHDSHVAEAGIAQAAAATALAMPPDPRSSTE